jgi:hypothetical protein
MIIGCLVVMGIFAAGCATTNSTNDVNRFSRDNDLSRLSKKEIAAYNANPDNTDKIVCTSEKPVGSNIPVRECHFESKIKERQEKDQQALREIVGKTLPGGPSK